MYHNIGTSLSTLTATPGNHVEASRLVPRIQDAQVPRGNAITAGNLTDRPPNVNAHHEEPKQTFSHPACIHGCCLTIGGDRCCYRYRHCCLLVCSLHSTQTATTTRGRWPSKCTQWYVSVISHKSSRQPESQNKRPNQIGACRCFIQDVVNRTVKRAVQKFRQLRENRYFSHLLCERKNRMTNTPTHHATHHIARMLVIPTQNTTLYRL